MGKGCAVSRLGILQVQGTRGILVVFQCFRDQIEYGTGRDNCPPES